VDRIAGWSQALLIAEYSDICVTPFCFLTQGWDKLGNYPDVQQYLDRMQQRDSWKATQYAPEIVVAGWKEH
jgi:glutathione S-transferase